MQAPLPLPVGSASQGGCICAIALDALVLYCLLLAALGALGMRVEYVEAFSGTPVGESGYAVIAKLYGLTVLRFLRISFIVFLLRTLAGDAQSVGLGLAFMETALFFMGLIDRRIPPSMYAECQYVQAGPGPCLAFNAAVTGLLCLIWPKIGVRAMYNGAMDLRRTMEV